MIPISRPYLGQEELEAISKVFDSRWLGLGSTVKEFEAQVAEFIHAPNFLATNTGTTALHLSLRACGIGQGNEVICPSLTFVSSPQAISASGAEAVFCDIEKRTLNIDVNKIESLITEKTKAIMPVHYRGLSCNLDELHKIAGKYKLLIIEDAAHAFGSKYKGKMIGSFGDVICFSFDPIKNITCGEGGGIVFHDEKKYKIAERMRILGIDKDTWSRYQNKRSWNYDVTTEGYRYHMPNFCAAIGLEQLKRFDKMINRKIDICKKYDSAFENLKNIQIITTDYSTTAPFMYIVLAKTREKFMEYMKSKEIDTGIHYIPSHQFLRFSKNRSSDLTITNLVANQITTLPLYYEMSDNDVEYIINSIYEFEENFNCN